MDWGRPLAVVGVVALLVSLHRRGTASWRLLALIAAPLAFWGLTALARGQLGEPAAPRYLYPGVVFLLLIAAEASTGVRLARGALVVAALITGFAVLGNAGTLREGAGFLRDESTGLERRARRAAARGRPRRRRLPARPRDGAADPRRRLPRRDARPRLRRAVAEGAAAASTSAPAPAPTRSLRRALDPRLVPAPARGRRRARRRGSKAVSVAAARRLPGAHRDTAAPRPPTSSSRAAASSCARARSAVRINLRRFSDAFGGQPIDTVAAGGPGVALRLPADASPVPWRARLTFAGSLRVCGVSRRAARRARYIAR